METKDWIVEEVTCSYGILHFWGTNLCVPADDINRKFSWSFGPRWQGSPDTRFDFSGAKFSAEALKNLEIYNWRTNLEAR